MVPGGPNAPGRFAIIGTWWLLREIEANLLRLDQVRDDGRTVSIDLSATKTYPAGRGRARAHRCICRARATAAPCPACAARLQVLTRAAQGAGLNDLLFVDGKGGVVTKQAASNTLRELLVASGLGRINEHSMRRTGAQILTATGVEPWLVQWFGKWGSAAILAHIKDAPARAPEAAGLAGRVRAALEDGAHDADKPGPETGDRLPTLALKALHEHPAAQPNAPADAQDLADMARSLVAEHLAEAEKEKVLYVQNRITSVIHVSVSEVALGTLCAGGASVWESWAGRDSAHAVARRPGRSALRQVRVAHGHANPPRRMRRRDDGPAGTRSGVVLEFGLGQLDGRCHAGRGEPPRGRPRFATRWARGDGT